MIGKAEVSKFLGFMICLAVLVAAVRLLMISTVVVYQESHKNRGINLKAEVCAEKLTEHEAMIIARHTSELAVKSYLNSECVIIHTARSKEDVD